MSNVLKIWDEASQRYVGIPSIKGADGSTFIPSVSAEGVITWTNNGGLPNPTAVDLVAAVIDALPNGEAVSY